MAANVLASFRTGDGDQVSKINLNLYLIPLNGTKYAVTNIIDSTYEHAFCKKSTWVTFFKVLRSAGKNLHVFTLYFPLTMSRSKFF